MSLDRVQSRYQSQVPQGCLYDPILRYVVAQLVEGTVRGSVGQQVPLDRRREIQLALDSPDVLVNREVVAIKPTRYQPRDAIVQYLREQVDQSLKLLGSDVDRLAYPDMIPSVREKIIDVTNRNFHASRARIASFTRSGRSNQYSRNSGSISRRMIAWYQESSNPPSSSPGQKKL